MVLMVIETRDRRNGGEDNNADIKFQIQNKLLHMTESNNSRHFKHEKDPDLCLYIFYKIS